MMAVAAPASHRPIRVGLADDHRIMRDGLCALLGRQADMEVVGTAADGLEAVRLAREQQPDVMITDINMPGLNGIEAVRRICSEQPQVRMLCLSVHDDSRTVLAVLHAGAAGYVLKDSSCDELAGAIRKVMGRQIYLSPELVTVVVGEWRQQVDRPSAASTASAPSAPSAPAAPRLTPRERELVQLLSEGFGTQDIAERLHVSSKTVATHREHVMHKLNMGSVAELTRFALREGLSSLDTPCVSTRRPGKTRSS